MSNSSKRFDLDLFSMTLNPGSMTILSEDDLKVLVCNAHTLLDTLRLRLTEIEIQKSRILHEASMLSKSMKASESEAPKKKRVVGRPRKKVEDSN